MPKIDNISFAIGGQEIFCDFSLEIHEGLISCILGPSGCGKTTLLNLICEIMKSDRGGIYGFRENSFSYIFQETRILPWRTVYENIALPLMDKMDAAKVRQRAEKFIQLVELSDWKNQYPSKLSGGMRQRIAIARALAFPSKTILMDEAFQSLDIGLKNKLFEIFLKGWEEEPRTVVFVTHDLDEALYLGNYINVLSKAPNTKAECYIIDSKPGQGRSIDEAIRNEIYELINR